MATFQPTRRWTQLSLRTVLVLVALLCVAMNLWVVPAERQRRAVAAIEAIGGTAEYVEHDELHAEGFVRRFLGRWLHRDFFDEVCGVWLADPRTTDADVVRLQRLHELPKLKALVVAGTKITGRELPRVQGLEGLTFLVLKRNQISDDGLAQLGRMPALNQLVLNEANVTDSGLSHIQGLAELEYLGLSGTQVTDAGLGCLKRLTSLRTLGLAGTQVTDAGLVHFQGLPCLEVLYLDGTGITDDGLNDLHELTTLRELGLRGTRVTKDGVQRIRTTLPKCFVLWP